MPIRDQHPSQLDLARFLRAEMGRKESRTILRHLMRGCARCSEILEEARAHAAYDAAFDRLMATAPALERNVQAERRAGSELWHQLRRKDQGARLLILRNDSRYHTWGLFDHIISLIRPATKKNPFEAVDLAQLALTLAERLQPEEYGEERIHDFLGTAWSHLGLAKRRAGDFQGAAEALSRAREELAEGSDLIEKAMADVNTASLLSDLGRFEEAVSLLDIAARSFRFLGDRRGLAQTILHQASILAFVDPMQGILRAKKGLALLPQRRDEPYAELTALQTMAWCYNDLGKHQEARALLEVCQPLYDRLMDPVLLGNRSWLLGRICMGEGDPKAALDHLDEAHLRFSNAQLHFDSTIVTLDRIEALVRAARIDEALRLARTTHTLLQGWGLAQDSLRLWLLMMDAIRTGRFLVDHFRDAVADHLRRTWVLRPTGGGSPAPDPRGVS